MKSLALATVLIAGLSLSCSSEPEAQEFEGTLDSELVAADEPSVYERLRPVPREDTIRKSLELPRQARIFSGRWRIAPPNVDLDVFLIEADGPSYVAADADGNGTVGPEERFRFEPLTGSDYFEAETTIPMATRHDRYSVFPIKVRVPQGSTVPGNGELRFLWRSVMAPVYGTVQIGEEAVRVRYDGFHPRSGQLDPSANGLGIDADGDGLIRADPRSPEWAYARNERVVFRVGDRYLSTEILDLDEGRVVLTAHDASEYRRIELSLGGTIPDFDFVDFEGQSRSLSEFRGRPVLLNFWGAWCGPCIREIPYMKEAYTRFQPKGLEILGLDADPSRPDPSPEQLANGLLRARKLVADHELGWPQARTESILELLHERFRIASYPTEVLLDAEGRIVSAGARGHPPLRGPGLIQTLEKLFSE